MSGVRAHTARLVARLVAALGRIAGKQGTSLPGRVLLALDPLATRRMASGIAHGSAVVSATNGKTTTATLVAEAMSQSGLHAVHNSAGANMAGGIAASLLSDRHRADPDAIGLFEVDEFWLPQLGPQLAPRVVLLGNLFRDQLDRYGELDTILDRWRDSVIELSAAGTVFVLCADDPGIASLGESIPSGQVIWFGIDDVSESLDEVPHSADAGNCRRCGERLTYDSVLLGHLGHWRCEACGSSRPTPQFAIEQLDLIGATASTLRVSTPSDAFSLSLSLPGVYNAYNAIGGWALAASMGIDAASIKSGFERTEPAFGRAECFQYGGRDVTLMLVKNPTGANEVIRALAHEPPTLDLMIVLNDGIADGRDVSWVWDADFELLADRVSRVRCSGRRASELALRLLCAGFPRDRLEVVPEPAGALETAAGEGSGPLWVLPTYTALLDLRRSLSDRGIVEPIG